MRTSAGNETLSVAGPVSRPIRSGAENGCAGRVTFAVMLVACSLSVTPAGAVAVRDWSVSTAQGFAAGTLDGTTIDERGRLGLAPRIETVFGPEEGIVWDVAPAGDGAAFVALSGPGRVLRVRRGGRPEVWLDAGNDALVTALTPDGAGGVFAGLSPSGRVVHLSGPDDVEAEAETGATFVWALDNDLAGGVWIGTGVPGAVARWTPGGAVETLFATGDDPVRSVLALARSTLVAGTGGRGRVLRLDDRGRAFVLFDADEKEVVDLAVDDAGTVFALTAGGAVQVAPQRPSPDAAERNESNSVSVTAQAPPGAPDRNEQEQDDDKRSAPSRAGLSAPKGGALYRIDPDGDARRIWHSATEIPFALARLDDGRLLAATGDAGRIHQLDAEGRSSRLLRIPSNQASALAIAADGAVIVGASSDARVALLGPGVSGRGDWVSAAIDAGTVADWGNVRWEAADGRGAKVTAAVRVGNTGEPDDTWSGWIELRNAGAGRDVKSAAPPARWMQIRLTLESRGAPAPAVSKVEAFFTPRNRPPRVADLEVNPAGIVWVRTPVNSAALQGPLVADDPVARRAAAQLQRKTVGGPIRRSYELGARTFSWKAEDPDDDRLKYLVEIRPDGAETWFPLAGHLEDEFYSWDARSMPDGLYRVRVTARDGRDNPGGKELTHSTVSEAFRVDNTRPVLARPRVQRSADGFEVSFVATDPDGKISAVEFALDDGEWEPLDPTDGVADSAEEEYRMRIGPAADPAVGRYLRVRVADTVGNLGGDAWLIPEPDKP